MNKTILFLLLSFCSISLFNSCKSKGEDPASVVQFRKLTGTWTLDTSVASGAVTLGGTAQSGYDATFKLTVTGTEDAVSNSSTFNYAVAGRVLPSPWRASGTFTFGADPYTQLVRDSGSTADVLNVTYALNSDNSKLQLSFTFSNTGYTARTENVSGNWVFNFKR